jgi:hypothetical protein
VGVRRLEMTVCVFDAGYHYCIYRVGHLADHICIMYIRYIWQEIHQKYGQKWYRYTDLANPMIYYFRFCTCKSTLLTSFPKKRVMSN